ncbi:MAG: GDP-mannose 4,6-dehydratase [bacterium]|nr:GDP-mannose 4,6-dehydratase [bacterium]
MPIKKEAKGKKPKVAIVTGGAGFIGSHVVDELVKRRIKVYVIDDLSFGNRQNVNPNVTFYHLSVTSPKIPALFKKIKPNYLFHFAAQISVRDSIKNPLNDARVNVLGSINVFESAKDVGVEKIILASSGGIMYPSTLKKAKETDDIYPESPYGVSKRAKELYLDHYYDVFGIKYVTLRFSNVYGPRQLPSGVGEGGVIGNFIETMLANGDPFITGDGKQTRDFVFVSDVGRAAILALKSDFVGIMNICSGEEITMNELFKKTAKATGFKKKPRYEPKITGEKRRSCMAYNRAGRVMGWKPQVSMEEGLKKTVQFFKKEVKKKK